MDRPLPGNTALNQARLSREPVTVSWLIEALATAVNNPEMRRLSATVITNWLLQQGFLEKHTTPDGKNTCVPTTSGRGIGLTCETRQGREGEYQMVLYDLNAQRFVLDHLLEMIKYFFVDAASEKISIVYTQHKIS